MEIYDFNTPIDRHQSDSWKYNEIINAFGRADLIPMWVADMDFEVCHDITDSIRRRLDHPIFGYATDSPDCPGDKLPCHIAAWLAKRHHFAASPEEIAFIPGIVKGIGLAINYFAYRNRQAGDTKPFRVLIEPPVYHPFRNVTIGNGCEVVTAPLKLVDGRLDQDLELLESVVKEKHPQMMILCNPHNPSGRQWSREQLQCLARIAYENNMIVISDEIHSDLMAPDVEHVPYLSVSDEARATGIMFGAPSKTFNIPGLVSSWCVIKNPALRDGFFHWLEVNELSTPTFFATIATKAAYKHGEEWLDQAIAYIRDNARYAIDRLQAISGGRIKAEMPDASFLLWLDCRDLGMTHEELKDFFVNECLIAMNDGETFGTEGRGFMRMNIACARPILEKAVNQIESALNKRNIK